MALGGTAGFGGIAGFGGTAGLGGIVGFGTVGWEGFGGTFGTGVLELEGSALSDGADGADGGDGAGGADAGGNDFDCRTEWELEGCAALPGCLDGLLAFVILPLLLLSTSSGVGCLAISGDKVVTFWVPLDCWLELSSMMRFVAVDTASSVVAGRDSIGCRGRDAGVGDGGRDACVGDSGREGGVKLCSSTF